MIDPTTIDAIVHDPAFRPYWGWHDEWATAQTYYPAIQQHRDEFLAFLKSCEQRGALEKVLILGLGAGGAMHAIFQALAPMVHTVDIDPAVVAHYITARGDAHGLFCGDAHSPEVAALVAENAPYTLLFLDADHTTHGTITEHGLYAPLVEGIVAFHDYRYPEVEAAVTAVTALCTLHITEPRRLGIAWYDTREGLK